jgi:dienelactone hydrolase
VKRVLVFMALIPASLAAQQPVDRGAFLLHVGTDTLVLEQFARVGDTVGGVVFIKNQTRVAYRATLGADQAVAVLSEQIFGINARADAIPQQEFTLTMRGDSAFLMVNGASHAFATPPSTLPLMNNSFGLEELFTRRARHHGDSLDIPVVTGNGTLLSVGMRRITTDSLSLTVAGQEQRLHVDSIGRILGGTVPAQRLVVERLDQSQARRLVLGATDYAAPAGAPYTALDVTLRGQGGIPLGGTLTLPRDATHRVPAVVLITGSGLQDRDESIPVVPGGFRPFRQIADTLSRRGMAVLRLDDRTIGASGGAVGTTADYAEDIRAAVAYLRSRSDIDPARIALLGHSEGGAIAPMVAVGDSLIKGIVLLAGPALRGSDIVRFQQRDAIEHQADIPATARDSVIRVAAAQVDTLAEHDIWLHFFLQYDPLETARHVTTPALILQGSKDHQVTPEQAGMLAQAMRNAGNADVTVQIFPDIDHLFIHDSSGLPADYGKLGSNRIAPDVLGAVADWLAAHLAAGMPP